MIELTYKYEFFERKPKATHTTLGRKMGWIVVDKYKTLSITDLHKGLKDPRSFKTENCWYLYHATDGMNLIKSLIIENIEFKIEFDKLVRKPGLFGWYKDTFPIPSDNLKYYKTHVDEPKDTHEEICYLTDYNINHGMYQSDFNSHIEHTFHTNLTLNANALLRLRMERAQQSIKTGTNLIAGMGIKSNVLVNCGPLMQILMLVYCRSVVFTYQDIFTNTVKSKIISMEHNDSSIDILIESLSRQSREKQAEVAGLKKELDTAEDRLKNCKEKTKEVKEKTKEATEKLDLLNEKYKKVVAKQKELEGLAIDDDDVKNRVTRKLRME